ncbi:stAR-related lipid transfer protein 7, mitochondrial [Erpetoichthys calabaricus]|uniref:StAR-related lipid transfer protein 7, mitochondrial n=1 Tax=Erpetoichthys calabaricus TaxID=27687 RepID=A0A8C4S2U2_ERPCA|nr:stAR-related lipid transfer protein 7, mitochondrial [Erpetoichthys calabaricus]
MMQCLQRKPMPGLYSCFSSVRLASGFPPIRVEGGWLGKKMETALFWLKKGLGVGSEKRKGMVSILASQCSYVTGQRVRRAYQICELYSSLYSERSRRSLVSSLWRKFQNRHSRTCKLVAALAGVFMWEEERIQDEELQRCMRDMKNIERLNKLMKTGQQVLEMPDQPKCGECNSSLPVEQPWEIVMNRRNFLVWRRPITGSHLYEYRVLGSYTDVTPRQFFNVQLDTEYRKKWDSLVIKLEVVEHDDVTGSEVLHWVTHFPYPMYSRDYVYVRRYQVDYENNLMVLISRAVEHPGLPESSEFVRVRSYQSKMIIRPHASFDENGFDYLLTYSDDPQTVFPRYCVSWMVSSGMPDFLEKLHTAALRAKNMEIELRDYISMKPVENKMASSAERMTEKSRAGQQQMEYA